MSYTVLQNAKEREEQYINAINFYLTYTKYKIVFCNNSGEDISHHFLSNKNRVEFLSFYGNDYDRKLGKGYGEFLILKYAFEHSKFIKTTDYIIKITGRLIVNNMSKILKLNGIILAYSANNLIKLYYEDKLADSRCFVATKKFYEIFLTAENSINDTQGYYFEHLLYDTVKGHRKDFIFSDFCLPLAFCGISGSTGQSYNSEKKSLLQNLTDMRNFCERTKPQYKHDKSRYCWISIVSFIIRLQKLVLIRL